MRDWPGAAEPVPGVDAEGRITYTWSALNASASRPYSFGASFPKSYVPADAIVTAPPIDIGAIIGAIMAWVLPIGCIGIFVLLFVGIPILVSSRDRGASFSTCRQRSRLRATASNADLPPSKPPFSWSSPRQSHDHDPVQRSQEGRRNGHISRSLKIDVTKPLPEDLHPYENTFLGAFRVEDAKSGAKSFRTCYRLVKSVAEKMKGFSRKETQEYYKGIMERAWPRSKLPQRPRSRVRRSTRISNGRCWIATTMIARGACSPAPCMLRAGGATTIQPGSSRARAVRSEGLVKLLHRWAGVPRFPARISRRPSSVVSRASRRRCSEISEPSPAA